jgi:hypothetical protein
MSISMSPNLTHNATVAVAEGVRQTAVAAASTQAAVRTAEVTFHSTCRSSAISNGVSPSVHIWALVSLGQAG